MKLNKLPEEFTKASPVLKQIEEAGYEAYFVGGSVRDALLGQPIHDVDIATSAFPAEIKEIFKRTIDIGIEHGTVLVLHEEEQYEITTFRTESTYQDFRRPDHVEFVRSLAEDLKRRDFTINAFALKEDHTIIDLFDGLSDLDQKILRAVGNPHERFHEDALRMMRGLRFISQLGFEMEQETFSAIYENHALLEKISIERIYIEFNKLLLGNYRIRAIKNFVETECYQYCPGFRDKGAELLNFADLPPQKIATEAQAWALLLDQLLVKAEEIRSFLKKWKASNELITHTQAIFCGMQLRKDHFWQPLELYHLGSFALSAEEMMPYFSVESDQMAVEAALDDLPIRSLKDLAINGRDLLTTFDLKSGKWVKEVLTCCEEAVVLRKIKNTRSTLIEFAKKQLEGEK
ncbi:CCA tRNA nucleotidyltransferase [Enterococcus massiliensis]|uniref:CCA tRNA nucleotidyltransferase n=1 Tax=Enterococcus massiliensis TaxID=1640685 RepID=UPI00065E00DB|nr:CCA tRNA nucleotidyltransferase [Enterococcus massiliensis]